MPIPFFYISSPANETNELTLNEETSKHMVQVLRMAEGEQIQLTDGKGSRIIAAITDSNRKHCKVKLLSANLEEPPIKKVTIGISLIKNVNRFEWFLEKVTELGVSEIIPLICSRTEKQQFRYDRMKNILISAMLQSQQCWLPVLHEPVKMEKLWSTHFQYQQKFIAHCLEEDKRQLGDLVNENLTSKIILIGPEGDFTREEIAQATQHHFAAVALGATRLRTETAGVVSASLLCLV